MNERAKRKMRPARIQTGRLSHCHLMNGRKSVRRREYRQIQQARSRSLSEAATRLDGASPYPLLLDQLAYH